MLIVFQDSLVSLQITISRNDSRLEFCDSARQVVYDLLSNLRMYLLEDPDEGWLLGVVPFINAIGSL